MKNLFKSIGIVLAFSIVLFLPVSTLANELNFSNVEESLIYNEDGTLKEGFVEENPWENNFDSVDIDVSTESRANLSSDVIYSEEESKELFEELQKFSKSTPQDLEGSIDENASNFESSLDTNISDSLLENDFMSSTRALKSKAWYRIEFKALSLYAGSISLPTAGNYMMHSLQDKPAHRLNKIGSRHANGLSLTKFYTNISTPMAKQIKTANSKKQKSTGGQGSSSITVANAGLDFHLTYGKVSYSWAAVKQSNGKWLVSIAISDRYDYHNVKTAGQRFPTKFITLVNNHANNAQKAGAIVPYNITTMFNQNYKP